MITILVDEAYAFDFLAILEIKYSFSKSKNILEKIEECKQHLAEQLGIERLSKILESEEYRKVIEANRETFRLVELAKTDKCRASDVDKSNYYRCLARNDLQNKFFISKISEVKFGYEVYNREKNHG